MTKSEVINFLSEKRGYMKYGYAKLATMLHTDTDTIKAAIRTIQYDEEVPKTSTPLFTSSKEVREWAEFQAYKKSREFDQVQKTQKVEAPSPYIGGNPDNVLVIADSHEPFCKVGYLEHCRAIQELYNCGTVVHIGDEVDLCAISQWEKDPDGLSGGEEVKAALVKMKRWYHTFPEVSVCIGNHTARVFRLARAAGIPKHFLKSYEDAWHAPKGWKWSESWEYNDVLYTHGNGLSGATAAINLASQHRQSCVIGHIHTQAGIQYNASKKDLVWGMMLGGAIDDKQYAFTYAKDNIKKSIIGCGVVLEGKQPLYIPMPL